jgi:N6-adenosine-specific RNA methylase IME4
MNTFPIAKIRVRSRHRKDHGDVGSLASSIAEIGLLHPVVVRPDYTLISGERRLRAVQTLGWTEVPIRVVDGLDDALQALRAESDENVCRKDFLPSEAVAMASAIEEVERREARKRQKEHSQTAPGKPKDTGGNLPQVIEPKVRDKVGAAVGLSGRSYEKAKAVVAAAEAPDARAEVKKLLDDMDRTGKVDGVFKRLRTMQAAEEIRAETPPLPDGPFRVIVVDPPWQYDARAEDASHRAANPYPSMSVEDIKGLDVAGRAHTDCVLWLWTTNAHIPHAFGIVEAWGFTYKTVLTWVKDKMGTGDWLRGKTEHCLMAVRGRPTITLTNQTTALSGPLRKHSEKPEEFYQLIESLCPGSKLEMFCRSPRDGWASHGNEVR